MNIDEKKKKESIAVVNEKLNADEKNIMCFKDQYGTPCALMTIGTRPREVFYLNNKEVQHIVYAEIKEQSQAEPTRKYIKERILDLESRAIAKRFKRTVYTRVGGDGCDNVYINLANEDREVVQIHAGGFNIGQMSDEVIFRTTESMLPLPTPEDNKEKLEDLLQPFLRVSSPSDKKCLIGWLLGSLYPTGPYPLLVLQGGPGTSKSTTARVLKSLIDPSIAPIQTLPSGDRNLLVAAKSNWLLAYDNLDAIKKSMSDSLCRLSTGGGSSTRKLYSDHDESIIAAQRPVILNGIDDLVKRGDLAVRCVTIRLESMPDEERKTESEFWREFEAQRPRILGSLYRALSCSLKNYSQVKVNPPRMADFVKRVTAAESELGWDADSFLVAYCENLKVGSEPARENDIVLVAIEAFMEDQAEWIGTSTRLNTSLVATMKKNSLVSTDWPKAPKALSRRINSRVKELREIGIEVTKSRVSAEREITLRRIPKES